MSVLAIVLAILLYLGFGMGIAAWYGIQKKELEEKSEPWAEMGIALVWPLIFIALISYTILDRLPKN